MYRALLAGVVACLVVTGVSAEPRPVERRVQSVGLFKNGLAFVREEVQLPGPGAYTIADVPEPVHGTFWFESDAVARARVTEQVVEVPAAEMGLSELPTALVGKRVVLHLGGEEAAVVKGRVREVDSEAPSPWRRDYVPSPWSSYRYRAPARPRRWIVVETRGGLTYVDPSRVQYAEVLDDAAATATRRRPVLHLEVEEPAKVALSYLAKGMAWAPSYRVDISDPRTLRIEQKAVIKNELCDIQGAEVYLISGFPNVEFSAVTSPLSLKTTWEQFFRQLSRPRWRGPAVTSNVVLQQAATPAGGGPSLAELGMAAIPTGEGPDLHYQPVGKLTLREGEAALIKVAAASAPYERVVEWLIPDTRDEGGRRITDWQRQRDPERYDDTAWDAVRFRNPLPFPMTTAPAMVCANGRFLGQRTSTWTNVGEWAILRVTKALSIRTRCVEVEATGGQRERLYIMGNSYQRCTVRGSVTANNHRAEPIKLFIRRRFSGELVEADGDPKVALLEAGVYSINPRNELLWVVSVPAGGEVTFNYTYKVLVRI